MKIIFMWTKVDSGFLDKRGWSPPLNNYGKIQITSMEHHNDALMFVIYLHYSVSFKSHSNVTLHSLISVGGKLAWK